jgi:hypothetical protein
MLHNHITQLSILFYILSLLLQLLLVFVCHITFAVAYHLQQCGIFLYNLLANRNLIYF